MYGQSRGRGRGDYSSGGGSHGRQRVQTQFRRPDDAPDLPRTGPLVFEEKERAVETSSGTTAGSKFINGISPSTSIATSQTIKKPLVNLGKRLILLYPTFTSLLCLFLPESISP